MEPVDSEVQIGESNKEEKIILVRAFEDFYKYNSEKVDVVNFVESYINSMYELNYKERDKQWTSEIRDVALDKFLKRSLTRSDLIMNPPEVIGVKQNSPIQYELRLLYKFKRMTMKIQTLTVEKKSSGKFMFIDPLNTILETHRVKKLNGNKFYYPFGLNPNEKFEQKLIQFNKQTASLFGEPEKDITLIISKNKTEMYKLLGYDYYYMASDDNQVGGLAIPEESIVFSGNGTAYYPHEVVHLYSTKYRPHEWLDEGIATYLGGHGEKSLDHYLNLLMKNKTKFSFKNIFDAPSYIDDSSNEYILGGFIAKLVIEKYGGIEQFKKMLSSGNSNEDFLKSIEDAFSINRSNLDQFLNTELGLN